MHIWQKYMKLSSFTHFCRENKSVAIYALFPESFCVKNLAIRKVFAFSDSGVWQDLRTQSFLDVLDSAKNWTIQPNLKNLPEVSWLDWLRPSKEQVLWQIYWELSFFIPPVPAYLLFGCMFDKYLHLVVNISQLHLEIRSQAGEDSLCLL